MLQAVVLFLLYLSSYLGSSSAFNCEGTDRIVGGEPANIKDFPYQLSLEIIREGGTVQHCGASIIGPNWALTAAHCLHRMSKNAIVLRSGSSSRETGGEVHRVKQFIIHPKYYPSKDYDIGVVKVSNPFHYSKVVQPIQLATRTPSPGSRVVVSGWGLLSSVSINQPKELQKVDVYVMDYKTCRRRYPTGITSRMLCAGVPQGGKDACVGDSGGPLVAGNTQVGIVSWGRDCALKQYPGVYTDVSYFVKWIKSAIQDKTAGVENVS